MVVLEDVSMLTTGHNQYLQPDYLSPVPPTQLDAKKSPLALLAQTCSQIGADSPTKPLLSSMDSKQQSKGSNSSSATNARSPKLERTRSSPSDGNKSSSGNSGQLAFKPYETNVVTPRRSSGDEATSTSSSRPGSKASSVHSGQESATNSVSDDANNNTNTHNHNNSSGKKSASRSTPQGRKSASPSQPTANSPHGSAERRTPASASDSHRDKSSASPRNSNSGASPIIRSGMEILSGHAAASASKDSLYKSGLYNNPLCCPPGLDPAAFRPPFAAGAASAFSHHHAAAAAALLGYPPSPSATASANPYLGYMRVKTSTGAETLVPVCRDPFCTGCQFSMNNQMMMASAGACPSGCTQCDHQKYSLGLSGLGPMPPPLASSYSAAAASRPHVCSWMAGESFCGKRFATGDELLQHLRTHTANSGAPASDPAALIAAGQHSPHPMLSSTAALQRAAAAANASAYPAPSLSPLSSRFHPYSKPGPPLPASPYSFPLGAYYSPYALYGQRIGAAVHP